MVLIKSSVILPLPHLPFQGHIYPQAVKLQHIPSGISLHLIISFVATSNFWDNPQTLYEIITKRRVDTYRLHCSPEALIQEQDTLLRKSTQALPIIVQNPKTPVFHWLPQIGYCSFTPGKTGKHSAETHSFLWTSATIPKKAHACTEKSLKQLISQGRDPKHKQPRQKVWTRAADFQRCTCDHCPDSKCHPSTCFMAESWKSGQLVRQENSGLLRERERNGLPGAFSLLAFCLSRAEKEASMSRAWKQLCGSCQCDHMNPPNANTNSRMNARP